jgi:peptidoglycan hydrolase-like protein with peptidoglycan-binding domain
MATKKGSSKTSSRSQKLAAIAAASGRPKDYVPTTRGLSEGDAGDQVRRLQQYLSNFGYLQSEAVESFGVTRGLATAAPATAGTFDNNTATALMHFQGFAGLPVTGKLDDATIGQMTKPRCGFPDVAPPAPRGGPAEFVAHGTKWNNNNIRYAFQNFTADLTQAQIRAAIVQAFGLWAAVTPLTFSEVPLASADIVIRFVTGNHGDGFPFDGPSGVLAHAFYPPPNNGPLAGDTHFDDAELWSVNLPPSGIDLVTVAAHEFGHALGLEHSTINGALMYPFYGGPMRFLHADDIAGIQSIYGSGRRWYGWESLGGVITSDPAVSSWASNRLDCFVRGTDNAMWHKWWNGSSWSGWENLGGVLTSEPAAVSWGPNRIDTFVRGTDNAMYHKWWNGSSWSGWENLGGVLTSGPAVSSWGPNRLDCFVRGTNNAMWHKWWNGSSWSGWENLGGILTSSPEAVSWGPNRIDTFVRGTDNAMYHKWWNGSSWSGWENLGGVLTSAPGASSWASNRIDTFVRGTDNAMYHKWWNGSSWSGWENLGGILTSGPAAVSWGPNRIDTFVRGTDNAMYHKWYA